MGLLPQRLRWYLAPLGSSSQLERMGQVHRVARGQCLSSAASLGILMARIGGDYSRGRATDGVVF